MDFFNDIEGDDRDLGGLLDAVTALISRDVKDLAMLLRIAQELDVEVPGELQGSVRAVKGRIIQFLNSDEILTTPGIFELVTKLRQDINVFLFPTDHSSNGDDEAEEEVVEEDLESSRTRGRGFTVTDLGKAASTGHSPGDAGFATMPKLSRRRSTFFKTQPDRHSMGVGGFAGGFSTGLGGFGAAPSGGRGYGAALGADSGLGAPGGVFGNLKNRPSSNISVGRGIGVGRGAGVGRGNGGVPLRKSMSGLSGRGLGVNVVPSANRRRSTPVNASASVGNPSVPVIPIAAHRLREFKIHGKIGEPPVEGVEPSAKDKDNLSYSNVMLQIEDGVVAGYEGREIVGAVVRATTDPSLRDFLVEQVRGGLTVDGLKEILGTHFSVKNATGLYKQMLRRSQREGESIQRFVQEMMKFRDQVLRLSAKEGGLYTPDLMQDVFQKGVYNGLRSSEARQALRLTLKRGDLDDFELRQEISELMLDEADHETLVGEEKPPQKPSKNVSVRQVTSKKLNDDPIVASVVQKLDEFKVDVTKDLANFKQDMLTKFVPVTSPVAAPGGNGGNVVGAYQFSPAPCDGASGPSNNGNNGNNGNGGGRGGHGRGGGLNRGRGGRGGGRGRGSQNGGGSRHPLNRPVGICEICAAANALFCNHCLVCGNVDHLSYYCPERNNPAFQRPKN